MQSESKTPAQEFQEYLNELWLKNHAKFMNKAIEIAYLSDLDCYEHRSFWI